MLNRCQRTFDISNVFICFLSAPRNPSQALDIQGLGKMALGRDALDHDVTNYQNPITTLRLWQARAPTRLWATGPANFSHVMAHVLAQLRFLALFNSTNCG